MTVLLKDNPALGKAHRVYRAFTADDELMDIAEAREKWQRDVSSRLRSAEQRGKEEGMKQGMQRGMQQARRENALKMLKRGFPVSDIADITGLSGQEIGDLERSTATTG